MRWLVLVVGLVVLGCEGPARVGLPEDAGTTDGGPDLVDRSADALSVTLRTLALCDELAAIGSVGAAGDVDWTVIEAHDRMLSGPWLYAAP